MTNAAASVFGVFRLLRRRGYEAVRVERSELQAAATVEFHQGGLVEAFVGGLDRV